MLRRAVYIKTDKLANNYIITDWIY